MIIKMRLCTKPGVTRHITVFSFFVLALFVLSCSDEDAGPEENTPEKYNFTTGIREESFKDEFNDNVNGWTLLAQTAGTIVKFADGKMQLINDGDDFAPAAYKLISPSLDNFEIEFTVEIVNTNSYSLALSWGTDEDYEFSLDNYFDEGESYHQAFTDSSDDEFLESQFEVEGTLAPNNTYKMTARLINNHYYFFVNERFYSETPASYDLTPGHLKFTCYEGHINITDVTVYKLNP